MADLGMYYVVQVWHPQHTCEMSRTTAMADRAKVAITTRRIELCELWRMHAIVAILYLSMTLL